MNMKEFLSFLSVIFVIIGLILYSKETKQKKNKPNLVVFLLLLILAIINTTTYIIIVKDIIKGLFLIATVIANMIVTIVTIRSKNFLFLKRDLWIVAIGIILIFIMIKIFSVKDIHIIMQVATTIPFIPLLVGVIKKDGIEPFYPWVIIFLSSIFALLTVLVDYSNYWSLIHPIRSMFLQIILLVCIKVYKKPLVI